jgi:hypothetical protein
MKNIQQNATSYNNVKFQYICITHLSIWAKTYYQMEKPYYIVMLLTKQ